MGVKEKEKKEGARANLIPASGGLDLVYAKISASNPVLRRLRNISRSPPTLGRLRFPFLSLVSQKNFNPIPFHQIFSSECEERLLFGAFVSNHFYSST
jgi:hypothetical protein